MLLWGVPAIALAIGLLLDGKPRAVVWTPAFLVAGISCVANARGCGRLHCYFTGPLYLLCGLATVLMALRGTPSAWLAVVLVAGTVLAYVPEWTRGRYASTVPRSTFLNR